MRKYSQSLVARYKEHEAGQLCGERFYQVNYCKNFKEPQSDKAGAGQWFEYITLGNVPKNGVPEPMKTKDGKKMIAMYEHLQNQAVNNFPLIYGDLQILHRNHELEVNLKDEYTVVVILDAVTMKDLTIQIRDVKTSGLLGNEWDENGWAHTNKHPFWANKKMIQSELYCWAWWKVNNEIPEFYFDIFSNTNPNDFESFQIVLTEKQLIDFEDEFYQLVKDIDTQAKVGDFTPIPRFKSCRECREIMNEKGVSLFDCCKFKSEKPDPIVINVP